MFLELAIELSLDGRMLVNLEILGLYPFIGLFIYVVKFLLTLDFLEIDEFSIKLTKFYYISLMI